MYDMELAVARGAALWDEIEPEWAEMIDTTKLAMNNGCQCIGGQLCDGWFGFDALLASFPDGFASVTEYGFALPMQLPVTRDGMFDWDKRDRQWARLGELWKAEIDRRLP